MKNLCHLLAKDLRRFWPLLLLSAGILAANLCLTLNFYGSPFSYQGGSQLRPLLMQLLQVACFLLAFVVPVVVIQEDQVTGVRPAWLTRPIRPGTLLASKLVFLLLGLSVPAAVLNCVASGYLGASFGAVASTATSTAEIVAIIFLFAALFGAFTKTLFQAVTALLGVLVCLVVFSMWFASAKINIPRPPWPWPSPFHHSAETANFIGKIVIILAAIGALGHMYRWRRRIQTLGVLLLLVWAGAVLGRYLPFDFPPPGPDTSFPSPNAAGIAVQVYSPESLAGPRAAASGGPVRAEIQPDGSVRIAVSYRVQGIPPETFLKVSSGLITKIDLADGRKIDGARHAITGPTNAMARIVLEDERRMEGAPYSMTGTTDNRPAVESALGLPPSAARPRTFEIGTDVPASVFAKAKGQTARAEGVVLLTPFAYRILYKFPLAVGVNHRIQGEGWQVRAMDGIDDGAWKLVVDYVGTRSYISTSVLTGDPDPLVLALVNSERNEVSISESGSIIGTWMCGFSVQTIQRQFVQRRPRAGGPAVRGIDADWIRHADLYILAPSQGVPFLHNIADNHLEIPSVAKPAPPSALIPAGVTFKAGSPAE
ncbi:MAG: hypothetical protein ABSA05_08735 [Opitutaceae bacterium]|jgi:hypothetical protein